MFCRILVVKDGTCSSILSKNRFSSDALDGNREPALLLLSSPLVRSDFPDTCRVVNKEHTGQNN